jgi:putative Mn2+ efflux pump MntP
VSIWIPSVIIGLVTGVSSMLGVLYGKSIGKRGNKWRRAAVICGGCILILIGIKILLSHIA